MKKFIVIFLVALFIPINCFAEEKLVDITDRHYDKKITVGRMPVNRNGFLYGKYPEIGADSATPYWLDTSSCTYWIKDGVATVACIVYNTGRGVKTDGTIDVNPNYYQFATYKTKQGRKIFWKVGENIKEEDVQYILKFDNGFLLHLFWQAAKYSDLEKDLD